MNVMFKISERPALMMLRNGSARASQLRATNATLRSQKSEMLRLTARIGYTPHHHQPKQIIVPLIQGWRPRTCPQNFPMT
jgi:hypothetical protein